VEGKADSYRVLRFARTPTGGFDLFEAFLAASGARFFETKSNDALLTALVHTYAHS
jgi:hypothetical protein